MYIKKKNLKHLLIDKNKSINDVLIVLNKSRFPEKKICIVVEKSKILSVLTDGDIRRILIKEKNLNQKIHKYLKKNFIYANDSSSEQALKKIIIKYQIDFLPLLNKKKEFISLYYADSSRYNVLKKNDNEVFILAGGRGKRMFPLTDNVPKPLLKIGSETIIETLINSFKNQGFYNFTISLNYFSEKIINYINNKNYEDINIKYVLEKKKLGTAGPISKFKIVNNKPIIIINGDIYTRLNFLELINFHNKNNNALTVCSRFYNQQVPYGVISRQKKANEIIIEKPMYKHKISAGIYVINSKLVKDIPKNNFLNMNDFINSQYKKNKKIGVFPIHELWMDIGDHGSFINAQNEVDQEW